VTLGFFSPLPPARTGVADYSASLLRALQALATIHVNTPGDVNIYHAGNNCLHREIYREALARPGVVILHDAVLQHFLLGSLSRDAYIAEFVFNYGEWHRELAEDLWWNRSRSAADSRYFQYPMLRRIAERSLAIIVHNPAAASMVRRHAPGAMVVEVPHLFDPPALPPVFEAADLRERLGVPQTSFLFGVFGHLRESKRLASVFRAFERVPECHLLIAGQFASGDLERTVAPSCAIPGSCAPAIFPRTISGCTPRPSMPASTSAIPRPERVRALRCA